MRNACLQHFIKIMYFSIMRNLLALNFIILCEAHTKEECQCRITNHRVFNLGGRNVLQLNATIRKNQQCKDPVVEVRCNTSFTELEDTVINITNITGSGNASYYDASCEVTGRVENGICTESCTEMQLVNETTFIYFQSKCENTSKMDNRIPNCTVQRTILEFLECIIQHQYSWLIWGFIGGIILLCVCSNIIVAKCSKRKKFNINHRMSVFGDRNCDLVNQSNACFRVPEFDYDTVDKSRNKDSPTEGSSAVKSLGARGNSRDTCYESINELEMKKIIQSSGDDGLRPESFVYNLQRQKDTKSGDYDLPWPRQLQFIPENGESDGYSEVMKGKRTSIKNGDDAGKKDKAENMHEGTIDDSDYPYSKANITKTIENCSKDGAKSFSIDKSLTENTSNELSHSNSTDELETNGNALENLQSDFMDKLKDVDTSFDGLKNHSVNNDTPLKEGPSSDLFDETMAYNTAIERVEPDPNVKIEDTGFTEEGVNSELKDKTTDTNTVDGLDETNMIEGLQSGGSKMSYSKGKTEESNDKQINGNNVAHDDGITREEIGIDQKKKKYKDTAVQVEF